MRDLFSSPEADEPAGPAAGSDRYVYSVGELNREIQSALQGAFPGAIWVRGEVQRLPQDAARRKHTYFELHGKAGGSAVSIPVALLDWDRQRYGLGRYLDGGDPDFRLENRIEVCLQCVVDFYPPFGKLQLKMVGVDKSFTLGQLEARRREVLAYLKANDLLDRNAGLEIPTLPLRVGLITSRGSAAEKDFLTTLSDAPFAFTVRSVDCRMMGAAMEPQVTAALRDLAQTDVDLIVITRGGGSKADLSFFDQQGVAVAIATCPRPVITAIGHEIDRSIADAVAHHACKTPTAAAQELVGMMEEAALRVDHAVMVFGDDFDIMQRTADQVALKLRGVEGAADVRVEQVSGLPTLTVRVDHAAERTARLVIRKLENAIGRLDAVAGRLRPAVVSRVRETDSRLQGLGRRIAGGAATRQRAEGRTLAALAERVRRAALNRISTTEARLAHLQQAADLQDPARLLARGWSLTFDDRGRVLRSVSGVAADARLSTRLADGEIESIVAGVRPQSEKGENE